jgi:hypothetical protein
MNYFQDNIEDKSAAALSVWEARRIVPEARTACLIERIIRGYIILCCDHHQERSHFDSCTRSSRLQISCSAGEIVSLNDFGDWRNFAPERNRLFTLWHKKVNEVGKGLLEQ